jgi:hypothetical protein
MVERHSLVAAGHRIQPFLGLGLAGVEVVVVVVRTRRCAAPVVESSREVQEVGLG